MKAPQHKLLHYEKHYSWSHPLGENCIAHKDGAVSVMVFWDGVDSILLTEEQRLSIWANFYLLLNSLSDQYCIEFHFWRERNASLAKKYLEKNKDMVRAVEFATQVRQKHAEHLSRYSHRNSVAVTITRLPGTNPFALFTKTNLTRQAQCAQELIGEAMKISRSLAGARLATLQEYRQSIFRSYDRSVNHNRLPVYNHQLLMTEQVINTPPVLENGMVKLNSRFYQSSVALPVS